SSAVNIVDGKVEFGIVGVGSDFEFKPKGMQQSGKRFEFLVEIEGGNDNTQLEVALLSEDLVLSKVDDLSTQPTESGKVQIVVLNNFVKADGRFYVYPHKICSDLQFYLYTVIDGGIEIKSNIISISVTDDGLDVETNKNVNNIITINGVDYEKVIGGETFAFVAKDSASGYVNLVGDNADATVKTVLTTYLGKYCEISTILVGSETKYLYSGAGFIDVEENTPCTITLKPSFWNEEDYKTFYFYILPKRFVRTTTLTVDAGSETEEAELKNHVDLIERKYSDDGSAKNPATAYKTNLTEAVIPNSEYTLEFSSNNFEDASGNIDDTNPYKAKESFLGATDVIYYKVTYTVSSEAGTENITFDGQIVVQINSQSKIVQNVGSEQNLIENGQTVELVELFKIVKTSDNSDSGETVTKVKLSQQSYDLLKLYDVEFLSALGETETNLENITKIKFPTSLNVFEINGLTADVSSVDKTKTNHEFDLNFVITELNLSLNEGDKVYLLENEIESGAVSDQTKALLVSNYVVLAQESAKKYETALDIKNFVEFALEVESGTINKITFKFASGKNKYVQKTFDCVVLANNFVTKQAITLVVGKAYGVLDLVESSQIDLGNVTFAKENDDDKFVLQNNNSIIICKQATSLEEGDEIVFNLLGRTLSISGFKFEDIQMMFENGDKIYSNLSYQIFDDETFDLINENDLKVVVSTDNLNVVIETLDNGKFSNKIKVLNFVGDAQNVNVFAVVSSGDYQGISLITKTLSLNSLSISAKYVGETYDGNQVLINNIQYNLKDYFEISSSDESLSLTYCVNDSNTSETKAVGAQMNYTPQEATDKKISLVFMLGLVEIKTIDFYVKVYTISPTLNKGTFFVGQTLTIDDLKSLVVILDASESVCELESVRNLLKFVDAITENEISALVLNSTTNNFAVMLGSQKQTFVINASQAEFSYKSQYTVYPDTKVSNYVSCSVGTGENKKDLA
ncbi:MAG: hypothetical protein ACI4TI_01065, partial [Christensenellales bacterium]